MTDPLFPWVEFVGNELWLKSSWWSSKSFLCSDAAKLATVNPNPETLSNKGKAKTTSKPANEVTTGFGVERRGPEAESSQLILSTSFCEPYREAIELGLSRGRNAMAIWQDLVSDSGFRGGYQTVKRFVRKLRGNQLSQPRAVIVTAPGEEANLSLLGLNTWHARCGVRPRNRRDMSA